MQMAGENIICFAKDFSEVPTSNNHVMMELARNNRVLWLNSLAMRSPSLGSGRDLKKVVRKLRSAFRGVRKVKDNFFVYTPIVLPFPHSRFARAINAQMLRLMLAWLRLRLGMRRFQLWTFLPTTADYIGKLGESLVVYYCVDEWSKFTDLDGPRIARQEREVCRRADIVFTAADSLAEARRPLNAETHLSRHGVDHAKFAAALNEHLSVPADIAALPKPVLGFYGTISDWIDFELIAHLARSHPEWSIALIGDVRTDVSILADLTNVHLLPRKSHDDLPGCCKGFTVGIIPYLAGERLAHVNPIKLREYLSAGLPVVSTDCPEVRVMRDLVHISMDAEQFEKDVIAALGETSREESLARSDAMRGETWEARVRTVGELVMKVKERRRR